MRVSIVTTTIRKPVLLTDYCRNAAKFGHRDVDFIVVGDKKTPAGVESFCQSLKKQFGYQVTYMSIADQEAYLKPWPGLARYVPYNCIQRRNVGLWRAYMAGAEVIITIDDDNFVRDDEDFIAQHSVVGQSMELDTVHSSNGWYNVCAGLVEKRGQMFYHRGFPLKPRWAEPEISVSREAKTVVVNAGLWLDAPDIDAAAWLATPVETVGIAAGSASGIALAHGTWSPFNSQNTALAREVVPAYFLSPAIGRYDDIWASYIVGRIADHMGQTIRFGPPYVTQKRNQHDYLADFDKERFGMEATDMFVEWLRVLDLTGQNYGECLSEIVARLHDEAHFLFAEKDTRLPIVQQFVEGLRIWSSIHYDAIRQPI
jgi:hypothetical protein